MAGPIGRLLAAPDGRPDGWPDGWPALQTQDGRRNERTISRIAADLF